LAPTARSNPPRTASTSAATEACFRRWAEGSGLLRVERRHPRRLTLESQFVPALAHLVVDRFPQQRRLRKAFQMLVRLAGVDQHLGAVGPHLGREPAGIEARRPGVAKDVDVLG